jgi:carbamoyl-phosphate synthase small subunit
MTTKLILEDGTIFSGYNFGYPLAASGEVVFNTGMVGYHETLTDPSYKGQILVLTYPLIGNYGVPDYKIKKHIYKHFESEKIHVQGLVVSENCNNYSHWNAKYSLSDWLYTQKVPGIGGIDTRCLTKRLRKKGTVLGKIIQENDSIDFFDPSNKNLVSEVSINEPTFYKAGAKRISVIDCGCKMNIIRSLLKLNVSVLRVPWNYKDIIKEKIDGVLISNGPGNPKNCTQTVEILRYFLKQNIPLFGICLGNQLLALSLGADTFKMKFGHRSQNQPCIQVGTKKCYITSQNHGYAVSGRHLPKDWKPWFFNANDGTNEGIKHNTKPFRSVQFHPEAAPGPTDTSFLLEDFVRLL